jgi:S1-C subfamily serine protease
MWNIFRNRIGLMSVLFLALALGGCRVLGTGVRTVEKEPRPGIQLAPGAEALRGLRATDLCTYLDEPVRGEAVPILSDTIKQTVDRAKPAVVNIYVETSQPVQLYLLGVPLPRTEVDLRGESLGSGFICSPSGFVLSNAHVVNRAEKLHAKTYDGKEYDLEIIALDEEADVALLRLVEEQTYPFLPMVPSTVLSEGDWVIAIGNPLGFNHLVSHGIFSHRLRPDENDPDLPELIFSDTPINPGNSGGPLLDLAGRAVGINTAIIRQTQGISLTIPSETVRQFLDQLLRTLQAS